MKLEEALGADLLHLAEDYGGPVSQARVLTSLPASRLVHASFRLRFRDGRTVKGRRLESEQQVEQMSAMLSRLRSPVLPRILASQGSVLLEEWIEGVALSCTQPDLEHVRAGGGLLGFIHTRRPCLASSELRTLTVQSQLQRFDQRVAALRSAALLDTAHLAEVQALVHALACHEDELGITHGDFCAENMVVNRQGVVSCIDNETLAVGGLCYDLARVWYRWPMSSVEREAFLAAYQEHRTAQAFLAHFQYWALLAVVEALAFRVRAGSGRLERPMQLMKQLAAGIHGRTITWHTGVEEASA